MRNSMSVLVFLVCVTSFAWADDVNTVTLSEAFLPPQARVAEGNTIRIPFIFPGNFTKRYFPETQTAVWGTEEDIDSALKSGSYAATRSGIFTLKLSLNVGYNPKTKKFSNEEELATGAQHGFKELVFEKTEIGGYPMATLTATKGSRHLFLHYIALGEATLLVSYFHSEPYSDHDLSVWKQFISGLRRVM